ncbi:MAG: hypothetical protein GX620_04465 [Chloroflexi bacterium]|nr:hypothetical protein [Chloroflexota bacterium]
MTRIVSVDPTVFFVSESGALRQVVRVSVENPSAGALPEGAACVVVYLPDSNERFPLGPIEPGASVHEIHILDVRTPIVVVFRLLIGDQPVDALELVWEPERHWDVYLVQVSHHDLGYTDLPTNVVREHLGFLDDVVRFCEQTADWPEESRFRYTVEQGWSLQRYVERRPSDQVDRLMSLAREGRVEVNALFGNETSELCGHEEQIRLLYPTFALKRRYGIPILTAELNDVPGLSWGLASTLAGAGIRYFSPRLPTYFSWGGMTVHSYWDEDAVLPNDLSGAFWWEALDGQRVLLWYGYRMWLWTFEQSVADLPGHLVDHRRRGYPFDLIRFGFESSGRDNAPPDIRLSFIARQWNSRWAYPRLLVSTNRMFFEALESREGDRLRVLRGDLPNTDYTVGALSTAKETAVNRATHDVLGSAEKLAACASLVSDYEYPAEQIADAMACEMLYDEHTWGMSNPMGPAQEGNWSDKSRYAYRAAALAHDVLVKSSNRLADQVILDAEGHHLVVFNPLGTPRTDLVTVPAVSAAPCGRPMYWSAPARGETRPAYFEGGTAIGRDVVDLPPDLIDHPFELIDVETAQSIPYQIMDLDDPLAARPAAAQRYALGGASPEQRRTLVFVAENVPSLGYRTFRIAPVERWPIFDTDLEVRAGVLENRFYRVVLNPDSGTISSIIDKATGREWLDNTAQHACNQVIVRWSSTGEEEVGCCARAVVGETGPVLASLVVRGEDVLPGCPQRNQEIILYDQLKRIDLATRLLKDSTPLMEVYVAFPFALDRPQFRYESGNTVIEPVRDQLPGSNTDAYAVQHWVDTWDADGGITWASVDAPVIALGDLWPGYVSQAHHCVTPPGFGHSFVRDPADLVKGHIYSYVFANNFRTNFQPVQVADVLFRYSLRTHEGDWREGQASLFGWGVSMPLIPAGVVGGKAGSIPATASFCSVLPSNVMLLTVKRAEDGDGIILRLSETHGRTTRARVELPWFTIGQAFATNLVEENVGSLLYDTHRVWVDLPAYGTATVRCRA